MNFKKKSTRRQLLKAGLGGIALASAPAFIRSVKAAADFKIGLFIIAGCSTSKFNTDNSSRLFFVAGLAFSYVSSSFFSLFRRKIFLIVFFYR